MAEPRTVVITGASRGLGLASAAHLYKGGWHVIAAMRSPDTDLERLCSATGGTLDDHRLTAVTINLDNPTSIATAGKAIVEAVGAPDVVVHNAGTTAVGWVEEMPLEVVEQIFTTNVLGPIRLTAQLLPSMRLAGRGRIVVVSSVGGIRGMPAISAYSASKGALERWAESLAHEIAPFGLGVTVLVAGLFRTDVLVRTKKYADPHGPYAAHHAAIERAEPLAVRSAKPPERFASALARALDETAPFVRHGVGADARIVLVASRLLPARIFQSLARAATGIPRPGSLRNQRGF